MEFDPKKYLEDSGFSQEPTGAWSAIQSSLVSQPATQQEITKVAEAPQSTSQVSETPSIDQIIQDKAQKYDLPPDLIRSVVKQESGFKPWAKSSAGAEGLMQLMPDTARGLGVKDPYDPEQNIEGGVKYLRDQLDKFGSVELALAAYNAGPGAVQRARGIPQNKETPNYVSSIMGTYKQATDKNFDPQAYLARNDQTPNATRAFLGADESNLPAGQDTANNLGGAATFDPSQYLKDNGIKLPTAAQPDNTGAYGAIEKFLGGLGSSARDKLGLNPAPGEQPSLLQKIGRLPVDLGIGAPASMVSAGMQVSPLGFLSDILSGKPAADIGAEKLNLLKGMLVDPFQRLAQAEVGGPVGEALKQGAQGNYTPSLPPGGGIAKALYNDPSQTIGDILTAVGAAQGIGSLLKGEPPSVPHEQPAGAIPLADIGPDTATKLYSPNVPQNAGLTAALKIGDKIYTGVNHGEAFSAIPDSLINSGVPIQEGFVDKTGGFLTREGAKAQVNIGPQTPLEAILKNNGIEPQTESASGTGISATNPGALNLQDPVQAITAAIQKAKTLLPEQQKLYSQELAKRSAIVSQIGEANPGEAGLQQQLGALKGELPKVQFESIRPALTQSNIDSVFKQVQDSNSLLPLEKVRARVALAKLLGTEGGSLPQQNELNLLGEVFPKDFVQTILDKRGLAPKVWDNVIGTLNIPKSLMASFDMSAPFRQGLFLVNHPIRFTQAFGDMFRYAFSKDAYEGFLNDLPNNPLYKEMRASKLEIPSKNILAPREEAFISALPEKIPGIGNIISGSNRAYSGFLNKLRVDVWSDLYNKAKQSGVDVQDPKFTSDLSSFINAATGRGKLPGKLNQATAALNSVFFSPKLIASRMQLLNPAYYIKLQPFVRMEALKSLATLTAAGTTILSLAKLGGADVETNPTSSDFGKIKVGDTRLDPWGGFQQYLVLGARQLLNQTTSSTTGKTTDLGTKFGSQTRLDVLFNFLKNKQAPALSFAEQALSGKDFAGVPLDYKKQIIKLFVPMVLQDFNDLYSHDQNLALGIPGIFGVGTATYNAEDLKRAKREAKQNAR